MHRLITRIFYHSNVDDVLREVLNGSTQTKDDSRLILRNGMSVSYYYSANWIDVMYRRLYEQRP